MKFLSKVLFFFPSRDDTISYSHTYVWTCMFCLPPLLEYTGCSTYFFLLFLLIFLLLLNLSETSFPRKNSYSQNRTSSSFRKKSPKVWTSQKVLCPSFVSGTSKSGKSHKRPYQDKVKVPDSPKVPNPRTQEVPKSPKTCQKGGPYFRGGYLLIKDWLTLVSANNIPQSRAWGAFWPPLCRGNGGVDLFWRGAFFDVFDTFYTYRNSKNTDFSKSRSIA